MNELSQNQITDYILSLDNDTLGYAIKSLLLLGFDIDMNELIDLFVSIYSILEDVKQDNQTIEEYYNELLEEEQEDIIQDN